MVRRLTVLFPALLVCVSSAACASGRMEPRTLEQDERDVLLAVVRHMQTEEGGGPAPILAPLTMEITEEEDWLILDAEALKEEAEFNEIEPDFPPEVFPDLLQRNRRGVPLARLIGDPAGVRWISEAQKDSAMAADGPGVRAGSPVLERIYPGLTSIDWLSRPGFDEPRRHASVAYAFWCPGGLCGGGGVYLLEYRRGEWRVITRMATIVS